MDTVKDCIRFIVCRNQNGNPAQAFAFEVNIGIDYLHICFELKKGIHNDGPIADYDKHIIDKYAKARIALYAEMSNSGIFETVDGDIEELKEKIARLEEKIKGFDVDKKMSKAESFLSGNMNRLSLTLDFEDEYRPIDLNFGLTDGRRSSI